MHAVECQNSGSIFASIFGEKNDNVPKKKALNKNCSASSDRMVTMKSGLATADVTKY